MTTAIVADANPPIAARPTVVLLIVAMLLYPIWLQLFHFAGRQAVAAGTTSAQSLAWAGVVLFLLLAFALPVLAFVVARSNSHLPLSRRELFSRRTAHLAFATPSLYVAAGGYRGLLGLKTQELILWAILWLAVAAIVMMRVPPRERPLTAPATPAWLTTVHGSVAAGLVLIFLGWHLANHLSALFGSDLQHRVMAELRLWYRSDIVQPILIAGVVFMMASGLLLARRATATRTDMLGTLQTLTGAYLAAFLFSHLTSTFSARSRGIDTDWLWATSAPEGLFAGYVRLIPHYALGVACLVTHLGCGLRLILLQHQVAQATADRVAWTVAGGGALLATAIMAGMLGLRL
jgi:hypothetical protein